jgi:hypothetical protein
MKTKLFWTVLLLLYGCLTSLTIAAQESATASAVVAASNVVPNLINYNGVLKDSTGHIVTSITGVTFLLYSAEQGGSPLWLETQNITPDKSGHYSVQLGAASANGIPADLFTNGEARWLAIQIGSEAEQTRTLLVAVPYAMKAADAQTLGGLPASAFMLAGAPAATAAAPTADTASSAKATAVAAVPNITSDVTTSGGTVNVIPLFTTATNVQNSLLSQTGVASINVNAKLNLPASGTATAAKGFDSRQQQFVASVFNSSTATAVPQNFLWQAEPVNNDTTTASGTLNLLYATGAAVPAETGLHINNKGQIIFAAGQGNIPGAGSVTSVTAGAGLTGGTITKTGTIGIAAGGVTNTDLAHSSIGVLAGSDLTGGSAAIPLGGSTTLNLDTTKVPLLAAANTFTANQSISGNLAVSGTGSFAGNLSSANLSTSDISAVAIGTTGVNSFDPGFSDFFGSEPDWIIEVENSGGGNGIISFNEASSGTDAGVYGAAPNSSLGVGVFGQQGSESGSASVFSGFGRGAGVWGDGGTNSGGTGIVGTSDNGNAGTFINNNGGWDTVFIRADSANFPLDVFNNSNSTSCFIDGSADLHCSGTITGVVRLDSGARTVGLSAIQSPKNWFEDFGSAELVHGAAVVSLDADFMQTVNTAREYQVFLTPYGDCKGLYVSNRTPNSFEVHELGGGSSSLSFGYRITALRRQYEDVRFVDETRNVEHVKQMAKSVMAPHSHAPDLTRQLRNASPKAMLTPAATKSRAR